MSGYPPEVTQRFLGSPEQNRSGLVGPRPARWSSIVIVDYDPGWVARFAAARAEIETVLSERAPSQGADAAAHPQSHPARILAIEHVGSTSVPGLAAKPIIDIDLLLDETADESLYVPALTGAGYRLILREPWWFGHRMLVGGDEDINLHVWPRDAAEPIRHRLFRDWLREHPEDRDLYAGTKRRLAAEAGDYNMAKCDVIDQIYERIFAAPGPGSSPPRPDGA